MTTLFDTFRSMSERVRTREQNRVLIAEDYVDLASIVGSLLKHCGFDVMLAHDGTTVLDMARKFRPHFILLDIRLPGLGGYEVAKQLRGEERLKGCVIIGISAYRPAQSSKAIVDDNFDHYLLKPFDFDALLTLLNCQ